jgi:flagellar biosynthesis/type III secretory pathway protein FliH
MEWLDPFEESLVEKGWQRGHKVGRERGREEGRETGREEGREEGRKEGAAELLERQLTQRFGELPPTYCKKLAKASGEQLVAWGAALLDAQSLKEVFK